MGNYATDPSMIKALSLRARSAASHQQVKTRVHLTTAFPTARGWFSQASTESLENIFFRSRDDVTAPQGVSPTFRGLSHPRLAISRWHKQFKWGYWSRIFHSSPHSAYEFYWFFSRPPSSWENSISTHIHFRRNSYGAGSMNDDSVHDQVIYFFVCEMSIKCVAFSCNLVLMTIVQTFSFCLNYAGI